MKRALLVALLILLAAAVGLGAWRLRAARTAAVEAVAEEVPCGPGGAPAVESAKPRPQPLIGSADEPGCEKSPAQGADPFALP